MSEDQDQPGEEKAEAERQGESRSLLKVLGPGLVTGAADDDPSGIGTYSQVGAQFGYTMAWTMLFGFPLLFSIQAICAQIGATTGKGIAANLRDNYAPSVLRCVAVLLIVANVINIGADLAAMGAASAMLLPGPLLAYTIGLAVFSIVLEVWLSYERYSAILKWTTLSLFSYVAVVFVAGVDVGQALRGVLIPTFAFTRDHAMALVAVFGTSISPYLFFWQAGQEVEEQRRRHTKPLCVSPRTAGPELRRIRTDTLVGMGFSHLTALFIILATAATLHAHGITEIESASQAASALRPIAGDFAFALFALGIVGTGLLAVPVLAGSVAYVVSETFGWNEGLDRKPMQAKAFYATIAAAVIAGLSMNALAIDPMKALYWSAVINGLLAPPLMVVTMLVARNPRVMGELVISRPLAVGGWISTAVMFVVAGIFIFT